MGFRLGYVVIYKIVMFIMMKYDLKNFLKWLISYRVVLFFGNCMINIVRILLYNDVWMFFYLIMDIFE